MSLIIQKYGGTSVGSVERIQNVAEKIAKYKAKGYDIVVVVSAMSGETNRLTALAEKIQPRPNSREMDVLLSTGEQVTISLLAMALKNINVDAVSLTGWQVKIRTDSVHQKARIEMIDQELLRAKIKEGKVVIVAGFQGVDANNDITTLGRGGSDTSAVAIAAAVQAEECQIFTDVDGVYTTDPRIVSDARRLDVITFEEMLELASLGSKVLQIRSVEFAGKYKVPLRVLNSLNENSKGTLITYEEDKNMEKPMVTGITFDKNQARINVFGVPDKPGVAYSILEAISEVNIDVDMIIQNIGESREFTDFSFTVPRSDYHEALNLLNQMQRELSVLKIKGNDNVVKLSIVGMGMKSHSGVATKMFKTLANEGINIQMISTSEIKISVLIHEKYAELATRVLHKAFDLGEKN